MQRFANQIKGPLWKKLKVIYDKYTGGADFITVQKLEAVVREVLMEETPAEIDYVIKNISRIDTDNSGTIEFEEFANFILKRHCGEMSLQKMHRNGKIQNSAQHKITQEEFRQLLNLAYAFLSIEVDPKVIPQIFALVDKDRDGLITYPEYFSFTDLYVLETKPLDQRKKQMETIRIGAIPPNQPAQTAQQFKSRFRNFLISELKRLFALYDRDSNNLLDNDELRLLLTQIFGVHPQDILNITSTYFKPDTQGRYQSFTIFVPNFLNYASEVGWFGLSKLLPQGKTNFNLDQFIKLVELTFNRLNIARVDRTMLVKFFEKLDVNRDGLVELGDFKNWISRFLSPMSYFGGIGTQYYFIEDDQSAANGAYLIKQLSTMQHLRPSLRVQMSPARSVDSIQRSGNSTTVVQHQLKFQTRQARRPSSSRISQSGYSVHSGRSGTSRRSSRQLIARFQFNSQDLAKRVRKQMLYLLQKLDTNRNRQFEQPQIIKALQILMKSNKQEVQYVIANVFRYDRNDDHIVTYEQLANFFLEIHCGELAIQRLHKEDTYERGAQRMMNCKQFIKTVEYALSFIEIEPLPGELEALFRDIDQNKDGWITYQQYFEFLIHYFGTQSAVALGELRSRRKTVYAVSNYQQSPAQERFAKLIRSQTRVLVIAYDKNQNLKIQRNEAEIIANQVLDQTQQQTKLMLQSVLNKNQQSYEYDHIVNKFLQIHASEIVLVRLFKQGLLRHANEKMLDLEDFIVIINTAFKYLPVLPSRQHYIDIFSKISSSPRELVTFREYQHFVAKYLGKCDSRSFSTIFENFGSNNMKTSVNLRNNKDKGLIDILVRSFREHYSKVDTTGQGLNKTLLQQYLTSIFGKQNKRDIDYLLWTVFRVDQNSDGKVSFQESYPFIFRIKAELALNDLHKGNPELDSKERLNSDEFGAVVQNSFSSFDIGKHLSGVFNRLDTDRDGYISDRQYLSWVLSVSRAM